MKLNFIELVRRARQPPPLQIGDRIDEGRLRPGLSDATGPCQGDEVSSCLFYDAVAIKLQLTEDRGFPGARRPGQNESPHASPAIGFVRGRIFNIDLSLTSIFQYLSSIIFDGQTHFLMRVAGRLFDVLPSQSCVTSALSRALASA